MANVVPCASVLMGRRHVQKKRHPRNYHAFSVRLSPIRETARD